MPTSMDNSRRCVIIGGADINNYGFIRSSLRENDFMIYCDCGLRHCDALGRSPDLIVGDFDSFAKPEAGGPYGKIETITLPRAKDDTDTVFASKEALARGFDDFMITGAIGGRFDHSLGNAAMLLLLHNHGASAVLLDDFSEMSIVGSAPVQITDNWEYFSLLAIFGQAEGVTIQGAKFPTRDAVITPEYQYGVSNEVLPGKTARVSVRSGSLLLIKTR